MHRKYLKRILLLTIIISTLKCYSQSNTYKGVNRDLLNVFYLSSFPKNQSYDKYLLENGYQFQKSLRVNDGKKLLTVLCYMNPIKDNIIELKIYKENIIYSTLITKYRDYKAILNSLKISNFKYKHTDTSVPNEITTYYANKIVSISFNVNQTDKDFKYYIEAVNNTKFQQYRIE